MIFRQAHRPHRRFARFSAAQAAIRAVVAISLAAAGPARAGCGAPDGAVRVAGVDERLDLVLADGRTVRLAGLAPPDPGTSPVVAGAARRFLEDRFVDRDAELERLAAGTDRWGRVLADVALAAPAGPGAEGSAALALLAAGFARVAPAFETRTCAAERLRAEAQARAASRGIWTDPRYAVIRAADADALRMNDSRLVVIEGTVRRVGFGRSRLYLDLAPRGGATVVVARKLGPAFAAAGVPVESAAGWTIRARGALDCRLGARLEVSEPAMIEVLGRSSARGAVEPRP